MSPADDGPLKAHHIVFRQPLLVLANGIAKCLQSLKPHFKISGPFVSVRDNASHFPRLLRADLSIKPYDEGDSCTDIFDTWRLWDTLTILSQMLSKEVRPYYHVCVPPPFQGFAVLVKSRPLIFPMPPRSGGSSGASGPMGSPTNIIISL